MRPRCGRLTYSSLARWCFRHPWRGLAAWLVALVVVLGVAGSLGEAYSGNLGIAGTESQDGADVLEERFGGVGAGPGGTIVFRAEQGVEDPAVRAALSELFAEVDALEGTTVISPYGPLGAQRKAHHDGEDPLIAYADVSLAPDASATEAKEMGAAIDDLIEELGTAVDGRPRSRGRRHLVRPGQPARVGGHRTRVRGVRSDCGAGLGGGHGGHRRRCSGHRGDRRGRNRRVQQPS